MWYSLIEWFATSFIFISLASSFICYLFSEWCLNKQRSFVYALEAKRGIEGSTNALLDGERSVGISAALHFKAFLFDRFDSDPSQACLFSGLVQFWFLLFPGCKAIRNLKPMRCSFFSLLLELIVSDFQRFADRRALIMFMWQDTDLYI